MLDNNPFDTNNQFFRFNSDFNSNLAVSPFSFQYKPDVIEAYSSNPNASIPGGINPTANKLQNLQPQNTSEDTQSAPTSLIQPKLLSYSPNAQNNNSQGQPQSSSSPFNSGATQLISTAGKHLLPSITSTIDNFGMGLGFGSGGGATEGISSALAAADPSLLETGAAISEGASSAGTFAGASLSGTLGAAGLGFLGGGILAGALGENSTGGSIGGGIGAGIGFAIGGPIGALIGGIGGSIFGGLFGNHSEPTEASETDISFDEHGQMTGSPIITGKNGGRVQGGITNDASYFGSLLTGASSALGFTIPKGSYGVAISTKHPGPGGPAVVMSNYYDPSNQDSKDAAMLKAVMAVAAKAGYTDTDAITNWFNSRNSNNGADLGPLAPSIPNNPKGAEEQASWQQYLENYRQQQNANAAPNP